MRKLEDDDKDIFGDIANMMPQGSAYVSGTHDTKKEEPKAPVAEKVEAKPEKADKKETKQAAIEKLIANGNTTTNTEVIDPERQKRREEFTALLFENTECVPHTTVNMSAELFAQLNALLDCLPKGKRSNKMVLLNNLVREFLRKYNVEIQDIIKKYSHESSIF